MPMIVWRDLPPLQIVRQIQVTEPWLHAFDTLGDGTHVRIMAFGKWQLEDESDCSPDGLVGTRNQATDLLVPDSPRGALLGKFGGTSALFPASDPPPSSGQPASPTTTLAEGQPFAIGAQLVATLPARSIRQLYLGFNDTKRPIQLIALRVVVSVATPTF